MKKTLTTMALVTSSILPLSNTSNAENETDLQDLQGLQDLQDLNSNSNLDTVQIKKDSQFITVTKKHSFLIDEYGNNVKEVEVGDKLQILKKYEDAPFYKVNYNGQALFIANEAINSNLEIAYSGTAIKLDSNAEIVSLSSKKVNVYNSDTKISNILFTLDLGIHVNVIEKTNNDWYKINYYGNTGFVNSNDINISSNISTRALSLEKSSITKTGTVYNLGSSKLNVRKEPNTSSTIIDKLSNGDIVTIIGESGNWYKININNNIGYVSKSYIKENQNPSSTVNTTKYTVINTPINLRKNNSWSGEVVEKILVGTILDVVEINGDWAKVYRNGQILYAPAQHLNKIDSESINTTKYTVINGSINLRTSASWSGDIYQTVKVGTTLDVVEITGIWATVHYNGETLYAPASYLQSTEAIPPIVEEVKPSFTETALSMDGIVYNISSEVSLNIRKEPSTDSEILTKLANNTRVNVIGETSNGWYKVNVDGVIGYATKTYIKEYTPETTKYTVIETPINLRREASWSGEIAEKVLIGTELDVIEINGEWASVYRNKETLFAPSKYLSDGSEPPIVEEVKPSFTETEFSLDGMVYNLPSNSTLSVRTTPFADGELVTTLKNGDRVNVIAITSNDWYKIEVNGDTGYTNKKYIKEYIPETTKYTVIQTPINLRREANWSGEVVEKVLVGTELDVIEINGEWASVYRNKETLFAPSKYLSDGSEPPIVEEVKPSFAEIEFSLDGMVYNLPLNSTLNVKATPFEDSDTVTTLNNKDRVNVIAITSNDWYKVDINGTIGYVNKSYIKEYAPETTKYTVIQTPINLRREANWSGEVVEKVLVGTELDVIEMNGEWASVYRNKETLFAPSKYLSDGSEPPIVEEETTPPNTEIIPPVIEEEQPPVTDENKPSEEENKPSEEENKPSEEENKPSFEFTVTDMKMHGVVHNVASNDVLNVRDIPHYTGNLVTTLKNNERVTITGITSTNWYRVDINGTTGYVNKSYITDYIPQTTKYKVITSSIDLKTEANSDAETIETISVGAIVDVVEINGEWATIYRNKDFFYAPVKYLDNDELLNTTYTKYSSSLSNYVKTQANRVPSYSTSTFEEYINPLKCNKFEFLTLNKYRALDVNKLDNMLNELDAGVLKGKGQVILDVAKKYSIDALYFISQSIHETGYGKSTLAKGVTITEIANEDKPIKDANGNITGYQMIQLSAPVTVYNLYGIGAYDNLPTMPNRALVLGTTYAYNKGWTSIDKALDGAGSFLSANYINSSKYKQNTLYKMRYNHNSSYIWHQYATTPWYSRDIAKFINKYQDLYINPQFSFDKPLFTGMSEYSLNNVLSYSRNSLDNFVLPSKEDVTLK